MILTKIQSSGIGRGGKIDAYRAQWRSTSAKFDEKFLAPYVSPTRRDKKPSDERPIPDIV